MANEIKQVYITGESPTAIVYYDDVGTMRTRDNVGALTESPASSGLYVGSSSSVKPKDVVVVKNAAGTVIGGGEYRPYLVFNFEKDGS